VARDLFVDLRLTRFSKAVIAAQPSLYGAWLARAWLRALRLTLSKPWVWGPAALLALAVLIRRRRRTPDEVAGPAPPSLRPALAFLTLSVSFYLASMALVLLVEPPEWRYLASAELLLPGGLLAVAAELIGGARRSGRSPRPPLPGDLPRCGRNSGAA
jgi:MYXO-CTERM domain-containing protein